MMLNFRARSTFSTRHVHVVRLFTLFTFSGEQKGYSFAEERLVEQRAKKNITHQNSIHQ